MKKPDIQKILFQILRFKGIRHIWLRTHINLLGVPKWKMETLVFSLPLKKLRLYSTFFLLYVYMWGWGMIYITLSTWQLEQHSPLLSAGLSTNILKISQTNNLPINLPTAAAVDESEAAFYSSAQQSGATGSFDKRRIFSTKLEGQRRNIRTSHGRTRL